MRNNLYVAITGFTLLLSNCGKKSSDNSGPNPTPNNNPTTNPTTPVATSNCATPQANPLPSHGGQELRFNDCIPGVYLANTGSGAFTSSDMTGINSVAARVKSISLDTTSSAVFNKLFGNVSGSSFNEKIANFIGSRSHYIYKDSTTSDGGTLAANMTMVSLGSLYNTYVNHGTLPGPVVDLSKLAVYPFVNDTITIDHPGMGVVKFTNLYFQTGTSRSVLDQIITFVHESRHSDCKKTPTAQQVNSFLSSDSATLDGCFYGHAQCPAGSDLAGSYACDNSAWGSYAINVALQNVFAHNCKNCTDAELVRATAGEIDARSRVLVLSDMLAGNLGDPDLTTLTSFQTN